LIGRHPPFIHINGLAAATKFSRGLGENLETLFLSSDWIAQPTLIPALVYGLATVAFPFFVLQPALGFGIASSRTPKPAQARLKSLATHTIFGFGMYVSALGIALIAPDVFGSH
jgi:hypothetical protein